MYETKYSDQISQVYLFGKQAKPNFDEEYILLIQILGIPYELILNVIQLPSPDAYINFLHVS